ncbi:tyrosine-type recombinase/integrase [Pontibacter ruber]|uniref:Tyrosine-type recombinase/integrase n=1 Tax=Pontibacter ruber TaxID=1343895 RepID=A0ABW5CW20_9BACT|nr:site-specific integrase [Pontibacter ruber]
MFTDPQIYNPDQLSKRSFINFYFDGERCRFYHGKAIGVFIYPNKAKSLTERTRLLSQLNKAFTRALLKGWSPKEVLYQTKEKVHQKAFKDVVEHIVSEVQRSSFSSTYKRDISSVANQLLKWLQEQGREYTNTNEITAVDIECFLQQFSSSGTYYQNKRRTLAGVFSKLMKQGHCKINPVTATSKRKVKSVLHQAYTPEQLMNVLTYLKEHFPNLFLCALLMYGLLLRPHREIRLLKRKHFNESITQLTLGGYENKSGRIRAMPIPEYVRIELLRRKVDQLNPEHYIVSESAMFYNESYFNTIWSRAKGKMLQEDIIGSNQTLYSFRHAAAVNVFNKTQNLKLLQQLLGHSSLNTSLIYLRSIGVIQLDSSMMPELDNNGIILA